MQRIFTRTSGHDLRHRENVHAQVPDLLFLTIKLLSFHVHTCFVWCRNESYSEPHCPISENQASDLLKHLEILNSYPFLYIFSSPEPLGSLVRL